MQCLYFFSGNRILIMLTFYKRNILNAHHFKANIIQCLHGFGRGECRGNHESGFVHACLFPGKYLS